MNRHQHTAVRTLTVACVLLTSAAPGGAQTTAADWKVGLAQAKITPEQPVLLAGYASRDRPFEKVTTDLYAKALALEDQRGQVAVLVTTDLIGLSAAVAEPVCARLVDRAGLKREQILLTASHTHTGPALSLDPARAGGRSPGDAQRTVEYTRTLQDRLVEVVLAALKKREPARLSWGTGVANFVLNRRQFTPRGVILGMNTRGPADRTVPVLRIDTPEGRLRAVVFGAATHNTTLRANCYEVCGDYAGFAQANLEAKHPGVQAMFVLGFAGDSDPYPHGTMDLARKHGLELSHEVARVLTGKLEPVRGPLRLAFDKVRLPLDVPTRADLEKRAAARDRTEAANAKRLLAALDKGEPLRDHYSAPVAVWQFGNDLTLVALSGEIVVDYVALLEKALGPNRLWLSAYANDVYGYLPSARLLAEGGYETRGLGGIRFSPRAQDALVAEVRELAARVGRAFP
jgi:hypothetical protein